MMARSTFSPARKVRSNTAPVRAFLRVVRTKAWPLPGLTCWNSTTENSPSPNSRVMPVFRSLVVMATIRTSVASRRAQATTSVLGEHVRRRQPSSVTTTVSSIRTPPVPAR